MIPCLLGALILLALRRDLRFAGRLVGVLAVLSVLSLAAARFIPTYGSEGSAVIATIVVAFTIGAVIVFCATAVLNQRRTH